MANEVEFKKLNKPKFEKITLKRNFFKIEFLS